MTAPTYVRLVNIEDNTFTPHSHVLLKRDNRDDWTACGVGIGLHLGDTAEDAPSAPVCGNCRRITGGAA